MRRTKLLCLMLAACTLLNACAKEDPEPAVVTAPVETAKNLLLICIDTVRADVFYAMDQSGADDFTAWQDRGLTFTRASSSSSWTVPAVSTVFSGLWHYGHGAGHMPSMKVEDEGTDLLPTHVPTAIHADVPLLVQAANQAGFHTATISASPWTNASNNPVGLSQGFQERISIGMHNSKAGYRKMQEVLARKPQDAPFFYYLHFMEAHEWHMGSEAAVNKRLARYSPEELARFLGTAPPQACADEQSILCRKFLAYAAAVSHLRDVTAEILTKMEDEGLLEDTVVVLFSDHGERFGDHEDDHRVVQASKDRFVGHGHSMYQELLHVPVIAWHPGHKGKVIDELVSLVDIAPTAARWLDIEFLPAEWPGHYLDDYLQPSPSAPDRVAYASGIVRGQQQISALQGKNKSIWYIESDEYDYFDLGNDPYELNSQPSNELILHFDGLILDYVESKRDVELKPVSFTAEQLERLQAIGYLQGSDGDSGDTKASQE